MIWRKLLITMVWYLFAKPQWHPSYPISSTWSSIPNRKVVRANGTWIITMRLAKALPQDRYHVYITGLQEEGDMMRKTPNSSAYLMLPTWPGSSAWMNSCHSSVRSTACCLAVPAFFTWRQHWENIPLDCTHRWNLFIQVVGCHWEDMLNTWWLTKTAAIVVAWRVCLRKWNHGFQVKELKVSNQLNAPRSIAGYWR